MSAVTRPSLPTTSTAMGCPLSRGWWFHRRKWYRRAGAAPLAHPPIVLQTRLSGSGRRKIDQFENGPVGILEAAELAAVRHRNHFGQKLNAGCPKPCHLVVDADRPEGDANGADVREIVGRRSMGGWLGPLDEVDACA